MRYFLSKIFRAKLKLVQYRSVMRKSEFVNVSGVPNLVITYGGWIDDCSAAEVVLVIPGKLFTICIIVCNELGSGIHFANSVGQTAGRLSKN